MLPARTRLRVAAALAAIAMVVDSDSLTNGFTLDTTLILLRDPRIQKVTAENLKLILTKEYWFPSLYSVSSSSVPSWPNASSTFRLRLSLSR
jgi:hypothetical protein